MIINIRGHKIPLIKVVCLLLYKGFAQYLPVSYKYGKLGYWSKKIRFYICRHIFQECGVDVNVEHRADFGTGFRLRIGSHLSIGINAKIPNNVRIGSNVMMGPRCEVLSQNHVYERIDIPKWQQGMIASPSPQ